MVQKIMQLNDVKQLSSARGATKDLTAQFLKFKNCKVDSDNSEYEQQTMFSDPKSR